MDQRALWWREVIMLDSQSGSWHKVNIGVGKIGEKRNQSESQKYLKDATKFVTYYVLNCRPDDRL